MTEAEIYTLLADAIARNLPLNVPVLRKQNPQMVGVPKGPVVYLETVIPAMPVGVRGRRDYPNPIEGEPMIHEEVQWFETAIQVSALAPLLPGALTSSDYLKRALNALQSDAGLDFLAASKVRPLRISSSRTVFFSNEKQQFEANPSFDIVLSHRQIEISSTAPVSDIVGDAAAI